MSDNTDEQVAIEDNDPRFLHIMDSQDGADVSRRYFKNIQTDYQMKKCKDLENHNMDLFCRFIYMGKAMIDYAAAGDLENFKRLFSEADDKEMLYWHITKCLKAAIKNKRMLVVEFIIEDLDMPLNHEAFTGMFHLFIFQCQEAAKKKNELNIEINRQIIRYLCKGYGKGKIDMIDKSNGSTPLILACELLADPIIIETLVDGGADVNAVNCDDGMPLLVIKNRLKNEPDNYDLQDIYEYLKRKGAVRDWRKLPKE